jgi:hypothetical protein
VVTLLNALAPLLDVLLLCSFVLLIFGLIGLQVFAGALQNRCAPPRPASQPVAQPAPVLAAPAAQVALPPALGCAAGPAQPSPCSLRSARPVTAPAALRRCGTPAFDSLEALLPGDAGLLQLGADSFTVPSDQQDRMCSGPKPKAGALWSLPADANSPGAVLAGGGAVYGAGGRVCPQGLYCVEYGNPNDGFTSFDNILWSLLAIFQVRCRTPWWERPALHCRQQRASPEPAPPQPIPAPCQAPWLSCGSSCAAARLGRKGRLAGPDACRPPPHPCCR